MRPLSLPKMKTTASILRAWFLVTLLQSLSHAAVEPKPAPWPFPPLAHPSAPSRELLLAGKVDEAIKDLRERIARDPEDSILWQNLFTAQLMKGDQPGALEAGRMAGKLGYAESYPVLVGVLLQAGHQQEARSLAPHLQWLADWPGSDPSTRIEAVTFLVSKALADKDRDEALKLIAQIEKLSSAGGRLRGDTFVGLKGLAELAGLPEVSKAMDARFGGSVAGKAKGEASVSPASVWTGGSGAYPSFSNGSTEDKESNQLVPQYPFPPSRGEMAEELDLARSGKVLEASRRAKQIVERRPRFARAWRFLGSCYDQLGDKSSCWTCTSNAVVLGDGLAVKNLVLDAEEGGDVELWRSLIPHLLYLRDDWQQEYLGGRVDALTLLVRLADASDDVELLRKAVERVPTPVEGTRLGRESVRLLKAKFAAVQDTLRKRRLDKELQQVSAAVDKIVGPGEM